MQKYSIFIVILLLITACTPSEQAIQTAIAKTQLAIPTITLTPSFTPTNTTTPTPIITSTPTTTFTPSRTVTPTRSATPTLEPTLTLTARAKSSQATGTVVAATNQKADKLATAAAIAQYKPITGNEFIQYAHLHDNEKVYFWAKIGHNFGYQNWEIFPSGQYETAYAQIIAGVPKQGETVLLYGIVGNHGNVNWENSTFKNGRMCGETTTGGDYCWAFLSKAFINK